MGKGHKLTGQPVFSQLLSILDSSRVRRIAFKHGSDHYYKRFKTYDHLVTMLYGVFHKCTSLREVASSMQFCEFRVHHLGMSYCPRKSTISDANKKRDPQVFEAIYKDLYTRFHAILPDSQSKKQWFNRLYLVDSTTISLFKEILKNAGRPPVDGKRKGGLKVHTLMKADEDVPCLVKMTAAAKHDTPFIQKMHLPEGSIVTFDRGYNDYSQYELWSRQGIFWVTRLRQKSKVEYIEDLPLSERQQNNGVLSDTQVILGHQSHQDITRVKARLVTFYDRQSNRTFEFITNNFRFSPSTIAAIYQKRWRIEILFKRIKQNYPLRYFLGDNENAIRIQVWCTLIADLLLKIVMKQLTRKWSFANLSSMIRIHLMNYAPLFQFLNKPDLMLINNNNQATPQHNLFRQPGGLFPT